MVTARIGWTDTKAVARLSVLLTCLLLLTVGGDTSAQTLQGVLLDREADQPIPLGLITLFRADGDSVDAVLTDVAGRFSVTAQTGGEFLLAASALGYQPTVASSLFTIADGAVLSVQFRIRPIPLELGGMTVEARRSFLRAPRLVQNGFVDRAQGGFGRFITPHDIQTTPATTTADLLARTGQVTTRYGIGGDRVLMRGTRGFCTPAVYLDGFRVSMSEGPLESIVPLAVLEAAEVYRSANEAPVQYGGGIGGCGVIVLWTRAR